MDHTSALNMRVISYRIRITRIIQCKPFTCVRNVCTFYVYRHMKRLPITTVNMYTTIVYVVAIVLAPGNREKLYEQVQLCIKLKESLRQMCEKIVTPNSLCLI